MQVFAALRVKCNEERDLAHLETLFLVLVSSHPRYLIISNHLTNKGLSGGVESGCTAEVLHREVGGKLTACVLQ